MIERITQVKLICDNCGSIQTVDLPQNGIINTPGTWMPKTVDVNSTTPTILNCGKCKK